MGLNRGSLHLGMCAAWAALSVWLTACGGGAAAPTNAPAPAPSTGAAPAASPARPALSSPVASPSPIVAAPTATTTTETSAGGGGGSAAGQSYEVQSGDTLGTIAQQFYGDSTQWRPIYDANKDAIGSNPDALKLGTKLTIPPKPTPPPS